MKRLNGIVIRGCRPEGQFQQVLDCEVAASDVVPDVVPDASMSKPVLNKIVSGGQTGVDRSALDVAIFLEIEHGGWCPLGRRAEDGKIPKIYKLKQTRSRSYSVRTERNVIESDGTCILFREMLRGGTDLTRRLAIKHNRPLICIDLLTAGEAELEELRRWINAEGIRVLNVAGPRESTCPGITKQVESFLIRALRHE